MPTNLCLSIMKGAVLLSSLESQPLVELHHLFHSLAPHTLHLLTITTLSITESHRHVKKYMDINLQCKHINVPTFQHVTCLLYVAVS